MPPYVAVPHLRGGTDNFFHYAAYLGGAANPFIVESDPNDPKYRVANLSLPDGPARSTACEDRRRAARRARRQRRERRARSSRDLDAALPARLRHADQHAGRATAFDITAEAGRSCATAYGRHTFGQSACWPGGWSRRACTFVTVNCVPWDHHGTANRSSRPRRGRSCSSRRSTGPSRR